MVKGRILSMKRTKGMIPFLIGIGFACLWGGIYDFAATVYGCAFAFFLVYAIRKKKEGLQIPRNFTTYCLGIWFFGHLISVAVASDRGIAFLGVVRAMGPMLFWVLWANIEEDDKKGAWRNIPHLATFLTALSIGFYFVPDMKALLYRAGRLGGVFQYSNTYAMFLLVSICALLYEGEKRTIQYIEIAILCCGIVFCGSRSVMVLLVAVVVGVTIREKMGFKSIFIVVGISVVSVAVLLQFLQLDVIRLTKIRMGSSTLNGRFLYWVDAVPMMLKHPLGMGYMGYFFMQPQFQTGNYVTRFVHNDILQTGLDVGILSMIALVAAIFANILNKENTKQSRVILAIIFLHSLFDFDLQFQMMFCIMLMCMGTKADKKWRLQKEGATLAASLVTVFFMFFLIETGASKFGAEEMALVLYPGDTFARESLMQKKGEGKDAEIIIEGNGMLASAYECAAQTHINNGEYMEAQRGWRN